jgi:hypothetical protein
MSGGRLLGRLLYVFMAHVKSTFYYGVFLVYKIMCFCVIGYEDEE